MYMKNSLFVAVIVACYLCDVKSRCSLYVAKSVALFVKYTIKFSSINGQNLILESTDLSQVATNDILRSRRSITVIVEVKPKKFNN